MDNFYYSPMAVYGRELRFYRTREGLTQIELAKAAFVSLSTVSAIETGRSPASERAAS